MAKTERCVSGQEDQFLQPSASEQTPARHGGAVPHHALSGPLSLPTQSQAMRIVRTVGQAFEVCHKLSLQHTHQNADRQEDGDGKEVGTSTPAREPMGTKKVTAEETDIDAEEVNLSDSAVDGFSRGVTNLDEAKEKEVLEDHILTATPKMILPSVGQLPPGSPLSVHHQLQFLHQQALQQQTQTQVAVAQVRLLKDQLSAEVTARMEAQARVHQLLLQNKDLLQHVSLLVKQIQELELKLSGHQSMGSQDSLLEITFRAKVPPVICDSTTPRPEEAAPLPFPPGSPLVDHGVFENPKAAHSSELQSGSASATPPAAARQPPKSGLGLRRAVGAKVNDLLRRKDPSSLEDVGVMEVNRNVEPGWSCFKDSDGAAPSSGNVMLDGFPRLEPPPPTGRKRVPRALKTTQEMMISSSPVVPSVEVSSCVPSPEESPISQKEKKQLETQEEEVEKELEVNSDVGPTAPKDDVNRGGDDCSVYLDAQCSDGETNWDSRADVSQLSIFIPDLIRKDSLDTNPKHEEPQIRRISTPSIEKTSFHFDGLEDDLHDNSLEDAGNGLSSFGVENDELHLDLLSFES